LGPFDAVGPISPFPGKPEVRTTDAEGNSSTIPFVNRSETDCSEDGGWYVLDEPGDFAGIYPLAKRVFVLCQTSCELRQQHPDLVFTLFPGVCLLIE
jgi:hypothetical protein